MRLDRLLANLGYGSRREVKLDIRGGLVSVDATVITDEAFNVRDLSAVRFDGEELDHPGHLVVALHKPVDYVCSHDEREGLRAYDLLPERWMARTPRVESVGRLDRDTSGLLLLTDDHQLLHRLTSPKHHVPKRYEAVLDREPHADTAERFRSGALLLHGESTPCRPALAYGPCDEPLTYALVITEGRYHQVRRMFAAVGSTVVALRRISIGAIDLGTLGVGEHRVLNNDEILGLTERAMDSSPTASS